jgi:hypothetical protein
MFLYLFLFFLLVLISIPCFFKEYSGNIQIKTSVNGMLYVFAVLLICLGGFRWNRGTDWDSYYNYFNNISLLKSPFEEYLQFEPGYILLNFFIKSIYNSYTLFLLFFTFLVVFFHTKGIKNISPLLPLSFLLFFCANKGGIFSVRIYLARAILLYAINFIIQKKRLCFLIGIVIACTIHLSSLIFIIAYPLYHFKFRKHTIFLFWCVSIFFALNTKLIVNLTLIPILNQIGGAGRIVTKLLGYSIESKRHFLMTTLYLFRYSMFIPIFFIFVRDNNTARGLFNIYLFGCLFFLSFSTFLTQIQRAAAYFTMVEWILFAYLYKGIRRKSNKLFFILFIILYSFIKYYQSFYVQGYYDLFVPYRSIF